MISLDEAVTENDIHEMIREADVSNTGAVSFQEFENILEKFLIPRNFPATDFFKMHNFETHDEYLLNI